MNGERTTETTTLIDTTTVDPNYDLYYYDESETTELIIEETVKTIILIIEILQIIFII